MTCNAVKEFEGTLRLISPQNFGFVEDVFIDSKIIEERKLNTGETVKGRAIRSFNKKKMNGDGER
ncbi:hypothetical protein [Chitinophaga horti]|uniref:hypothetical protein n=1 Tax=Chitinophaga horti TaxID=2920382 RepID=UPI003D8178EA